jgi:DNA-binding NtrC family response regulator
VLIIDNDAKFRADLAAVLREDGHVVHDYGQSRELLPLGTLGDVAVVITDHSAQKNNGLAFAEAFHQVHPLTPVVVLTGYWSFQLAREVAGKGFVHLRRKPISLAELRLMAENLAGQAGAGRLESAW